LGQLAFDWHRSTLRASGSILNPQDAAVQWSHGRELGNITKI